MTVANRLSEDPTVNVLVLEAGPADHGEDVVEIPGFIGHDIGGAYDWNLSSVPQAYLDGGARSIPQGRALGGGTLLNGMLWSRGGQADYSDWVALGNPGWGWAELLPYFKASETYSPVYSADVADRFSIHEDPAVHGFDGPVNVSFPHYFWNSSADVFAGLNELGVPTAYDPNSGDVAGASFLPFDLDPLTQTRCTAPRAYYDPIADRPNLWISTGQHVTQLVFANGTGNPSASNPSGTHLFVGQGSSSGTPTQIFGNGSALNVTSVPSTHPGHTARSVVIVLWRVIKRMLSPSRRQSGISDAGQLVVTGVQFAADAQSSRQTVSASREVIVAAGALHTPQLLMLSGIGPASPMQDLGIHTLLDLPGVGTNLQDHVQVWC